MGALAANAEEIAQRFESMAKMKGSKPPSTGMIDNMLRTVRGNILDSARKTAATADRIGISGKDTEYRVTHIETDIIRRIEFAGDRLEPVIIIDSIEIGINAVTRQTGQGGEETSRSETLTLELSNMDRMKKGWVSQWRVFAGKRFRNASPRKVTKQPENCSF